MIPHGRNQPLMDRFINNSGYEIPPYGLCARGVINSVQDVPIWSAVQPTSTFCRDFLVNGPVAVPNGAMGRCYAGPVVLVAYETGTPSIGDGYGAKPDQFTAAVNYPECLICRGIYDSTNKIMWAEYHPIRDFPFMLKESLTPGGTATAYLTTPDGTIIDESTPLVVTVTDTIGDKRAVGKDDRSAGGALGLAEVLSDGTVAIVNIHQQALLIKATAKAAISGSTGTVDNVTVRDRGMSPVAESSTELSVNNPLNYYVADDGVCLLEWNESSSPAAYDITGVVMTAVSPMTDWQYNDTSEDIEEKTRATRVNVAGDESGWTKIDDTEECQEAT